MRPSPEEYCVYLADRIEEHERLLFKMGEAINNLDARLMMTERALAKLMKAADGEEYEERFQKWWN